VTSVFNLRQIETMPGSVIRHYREMKNYSQQYVAKEMGISQNAYSKIENNLTQLTVQHVKLLSRILQIPITDLLKDEFEIHKPSFSPKKDVTKEDLIEMLDHLKLKIKTRHVVKHDSYFVAMSLLNSVESLITHVY
jgi:transcriptional regulator with XRE-family HTH domain